MQREYIANQIKTFRKAKRMTAQELGEKLHPARSRSTITSWE